jgi:hypothetical protein
MVLQLLKIFIYSSFFAIDDALFFNSFFKSFHQSRGVFLCFGSPLPLIDLAGRFP